MDHTVLAVLSYMTAGVIIGCAVGAPIVIVRILWERKRGNGTRTLHDTVFGPPLRNNPRYFPEHDDQPSEQPDELQVDWVQGDPHALPCDIALADRIALARFVAMVCGVGPYAASAKHLGEVTPRLCQLRFQASRQLRRVTGLKDPRQLGNEDAERIFEELAYMADFLALCMSYAELLQYLVNVNYRPIAEQLTHESDVIKPEMLPSQEALKQLG